MIALDANEPGLWADAAWRPTKPGLFAVVIGVSEYTYLSGGTAPAGQTYGFGQLATSAITASGLFRWLKTHYRNDNAPLARARLVLAPSQAELPILRQDFSEDGAWSQATLEGIARAIRAWKADMDTLGDDAGSVSRALLFFSGHGIQTITPLLLPCDWLGNGIANDAVSIDNIVNGLSQIPVREQWFFCDACRDSSFLLDSIRNLNGRTILQDTIGETRERNYPIVFASAQGMQAYEPSDPQAGFSFFGAAMLDGLRSTQAPTVLHDPPECRVTFERLVRYIRSNVKRRLQAGNVRSGGVVQIGQYNYEDPDVTMLPPGHDEGFVAPGEVLEKATAALTRGESPVTVQRILSEHLVTTVNVATNVQRTNPFGSDVATKFFNSGRVWYGGLGMPPTHVPMTIQTVRRDED